MSDKVERTSGSSACGHSFVSAYQDCPRRWYLKFELGIATKYTPKQLTYGLAWHKAIETFHGGDTGFNSLKVGLEIIEQANQNDQYEYQEDYIADSQRFAPMFSSWVQQIGNQVREKYSVLSLEETISVELPNGFVFTGRLDELLQNRESGAVYIAEHKSTAFSLTEMERSVFVGDQVPGYMALVRASRPDLAERLSGCLLDVTYQRGSKVEARLSTLYYDEQDTARLLLNINGILAELSQKIEAVRNGVTDALLFPRNGAACSRFRCPYESICRGFVDADTAIPANLVRTTPQGFSVEEDIGA